jgi:hypothetical protein
MSIFTKSQPYLESIQYGVFFSKPLDRLDKIIIPITNQYNTIFDTQVVILPLIPGNDNAVTANVVSDNAQWELNISRKRADIIYTPPENYHYTYDDLTIENNKIQEMIIDIANIVRGLEDNTINISRLTNISRFIFECADPVKKLRNLFFKESQNIYTELEIKFNNPIEQNNIKYNNLTHYKTDSDDNILNIIKDFNTHISKNIFTNKEIKQFWDITKKYSHTIPELEQ